LSVPLIINGVTYDYPTTGDQLWGDNATDWAVAVTNELNNLVVEGDIGPTILVTIANNQSSAANVTGFTVDPNETRGAIAEYYVYRQYNSGASEVIEVGHLYIGYKDTAANFTVAQVGLNATSSGVTFSMTSGGQLQYVSSNLTPSTSYVGTMKFRVRALPKT
jgi:hypothetical protein